MARSIEERTIDEAASSASSTLASLATKRVSWKYAVLAGLWVVASGAWLLHLVRDHPGRALVEGFTGWGFLMATALMLGVGLLRNVREIQRAARLLAESEQRWKQALEGASQAVWDWNVVTGEVFYSVSWKAMLGYGNEEVGNRVSEWESRVHPEDLPRVLAEVSRHLDGETPAYASEHRLRCKDGRYKWILDRGKVMSRTPDGRPLRVLGTHSDIDERRRMEGELRQWADAFRYGAHGILMTTSDTNLSLVGNPALAAMLGRRVEAMAGLDILELHVPEDRPSVRKSLDEADREGRASYEAFLVRADGSTFPVQVDLVSVRDEQGRMRYRIATVQDISVRRQGERFQVLSAEVLRILNDPRERLDATPRILQAIRRGTGVQALGIRLRQDGHFPYVASEGFSPEFLAAENDLRSRDCQGRVMLDGNGRVRLECTCGMVLSEQRDRGASSWMTPEGSVWCNSVSAATSIPAAADDPRHRPHHRCVHEGYRSVALIPIRADREMVGLLQLNDRRSGCFTAESIRYFEGLAASVGVALLRLKEDEALRQAEQKYRGLFENSVEGIFQAAPDGRLLDANPAMASLLGFGTVEALIAVSDQFVGLICPDADRRKEMERQLEGGAVLKDFETELRRQDGSRAWMSSNVWAVRDASAQVVRYEGIVADITERKRSEAVLRERIELQDQLAKVATTVPGMIFSFLLRPDGTACLPFCTPMIEELWGLRPQDVREDFSEGFARGHPDDVPRVQASIAESARMLTPWYDTFRVSHPQKGERWLSGHSLPRREPDGSTLWHGFVQDVTEQKRVEDALRRSEERYRHLVETTFDWVWELDEQGIYTYVSPRIQDILGYAPEEVIGRAAFDLMPDPESERMRRVFREIVAARKPFASLENLNRHKDGRLVTLESSGMPIFGPKGELRGFRGMDRDMSEQKRLEERVRQAQRLEAVGQLAGGVAHDFNNILAATMMHLGLLQMNPDLDADTRQSLRELEAEARRAATLTKQLLMFGRRSVLAMHPVDLGAVIADLLKMLNRVIGENVSLGLERQSGLPPVEADTGMLEQVVVNLVVNARDAMPRGGRVTLDTRAVEFGVDTQVVDGGRRPGRFVCLTVTDTGHGMDAETQRRIFEPFFTTKEVGKGTGLGLATVHGIVAQHKGWVEVESEVGRGATFRVYLPAVASPAPSEGRGTTNEPIGRGHESVLVVEDDAMVRAMVAKSLRRLGYRVFEASNGQEAMGLWKSESTTLDLLLTDMVMPEGMTGLELTERLQAERPSLKAIISSGYSAEIVQAGVTDRPGIVYLPKPYEIETLARTIRRHLGGLSRP